MFKVNRMINRGLPIEERFMSFVSPEPNSGCWLWTGHTIYGYGYFGTGTFKTRKSVRAHRFSYELFRGPIPEGLQIDHLCRVRCCVNPQHLEAVTCRTNILRGVGLAAKNITKTHCIKGHPFDNENTYHYLSDGVPARGCKTCRKAITDEYNRRRSEISRMF